MRFPPFSHLIVVILFCGALTGCMVGPNFHTPTPPQTKAYTPLPLPTFTVSTKTTGSGGKAQHFAMGQDIPAQWWYLFHSPALNNLIETGLSNSPNLAAAMAALREAQQNLKAQIGTSYYPSIVAQPSFERQRFSGSTFGVNSPPTTFNLYNVSVLVSYTLDVFGGARRQVEAVRAQVDYEYFELEAAYLTLTSNIVTTSITIASLNAQIQATYELIAIENNLLKIVKQQFEAGGASRANILTQQSQLASTQATLPPLLQRLAAAQDLLSILIGAYPSEDHLPNFDLDKLNLPAQLPVSLPSLLACQRPDIRAAEALLHVASAQIGVATANMFPQVTITGGYGWTADKIASLFTSNGNIWNITTTLMQPIFEGGALIAKRRAAIAAYDQAAAQYRQTVLQAFQNVADTLQALQNDAKTLQAQRLAETSARAAMILTARQYHLGGVSFPSLLQTQQQYQQAKINRIQAQATRYADTAALFQALGGGWWNRAPLPEFKITVDNNN